MRGVAAAWLAAAALGGCADLASPPVNRVVAAQRTHEYSSGPPARAASAEPAAGAGPSAAATAITTFARAYINWSADTVAAQMRALAARCVGQAHSAVALAAAETASDYELKRGGVANQGTVEAVARLRGHRNEYVVVTRELTTATATTAYAGLRPAWHLTLAAVTPTSAGEWVVSRWEPLQ